MADKKSNTFLSLKRKNSNAAPHIGTMKNKKKKKFNIKIKSQPNMEDSSKTSDIEIEEGRQENSLCKLTKKVLSYIGSKNKVNININELVKDLGVKKRRIYDITNVFQGIGYFEKQGKNEIIWNKKNVFLNSKEMKNKNKLFLLNKEKDELNEQINIQKEEFNTIASKTNFNKINYIKFTDLINLAKEENKNILSIKSTTGSKLDFFDKKNSRKACEDILREFQERKFQMDQKSYKKLNILKNENHIFLETDKPNSIKIYRVNNGELSEIIRDEDKKIYYDINKKELIKNENSNINIINNDSNNNINNNFNINNIKEPFIQNNKFSNLLESSNNIKQFSLYNFLRWNKNEKYYETYDEIKNLYCGISNLFQKQ